MEVAMTRLITLLCAVSLVACGGDATAPQSPIFHPGDLYVEQTSDIQFRQAPYPASAGAVDGCALIDSARIVVDAAGAITRIRHYRRSTGNGPVSFSTQEPITASRATSGALPFILTTPTGADSASQQIDNGSQTALYVHEH